MLKVIGTFFNPVGWQSRRYNLERFVEGMKRHSIPLTLIECASGDDPFDIAPSPDYELMQVRSPDVLWQKERLFNIAARAQPADVEAVALIDADIIFEDGAWADNALKLIRGGVACVMPWSHAHMQGIDEKGRPPRFAPHHRVSSGWLYANGADPSKVQLGGKDGHPGFAAVFRRDLIEEVGLYERHIIGGGDSIAILGAIGRTRDKFYHKMGDDFAADIEAWAARWRQAWERLHKGGATPGLPPRALSGIQGQICHLFHGTMGERGYLHRYSKPGIIIDPSSVVGEGTLPLRWADHVGEGARMAVFDYLRGRNEDVSVSTTYEKLGAEMIAEVTVPPGGGWFDPTNEAKSPNLNRLAARRAERTGEGFSEAKDAIKMATAKRHPEFFAGKHGTFREWLDSQDDNHVSDQQA
jgi:hypothetical protein